MNAFCHYEGGLSSIFPGQETSQPFLTSRCRRLRWITIRRVDWVHGDDVYFGEVPGQKDGCQALSWPCLFAISIL